MIKSPVPHQLSTGQLSYQNFIQMAPLKQTNSTSQRQQSQQPIKPHSIYKLIPQAFKASHFEGQAYLQVLTSPCPQQSNQTQVNVQTQTPPLPTTQTNPGILKPQTHVTTVPIEKQPVIPLGKQCQQCKCILPQDFLKIKQDIIRLQNQLLQERDQNQRLRQNRTDNSCDIHKIKELQEYIDRLHDQTSIKVLLQQLQQFKDKQTNSLVCITQLSKQNQRLQNQCEKLVHKYTDLKQKSKYLTHNQSCNDSRMKGMSRVSKWRAQDEQMSEFEDYSHIVKSTSYINQLEESNTWLKKENKRLTGIIAQGLRCQ